MLWRLLLLYCCCCCSSTAAAAAATLYQQKTAQKSFVGWEIFFNCTSRRYIMHSAGCDGRWLRYFKTKWETNSDYIGTSSMWYGSFLQERPKICFIFQVDFWVEVQNFLIFKLRRNFFLKGCFCWTTFLWKATWTPYPGDKSFEQLFHIFWGDSHQTLQVG